MANKAGYGGRNGRWTALLSLLIATIVGTGTITSSDPWIAHLVGFLLTQETRASVFASANLGVIVSMLTGAGIYAFLTYVLKIELPGISAEEVTQAEEKTI